MIPTYVLHETIWANLSIKNYVFLTVRLSRRGDGQLKLIVDLLKILIVCLKMSLRLEFL